MRRPLPLAVLLIAASPAWSQVRDATARCREACERHVREPRQRASACGACVLSPGDSAAWVKRVPTPPHSLLGDPEWEVRWAYLLSAGRARGVPAVEELGLWLSRARGAERRLACETALHAAGSLSLPLDAFLAPERSRLPATAPRCAVELPALREAVARDLYAMDPAQAHEALTHAAVALELSPGRLTLDAMRDRPAALDEQALEPLLRWSERQGRAAGLELTRVATPEDVGVMNRVLAVASARRDAAVQALREPDVAVRKRAAVVLGTWGPWFESELLGALADEAPAVRLAAARGLAQGDGATLPAAVAARVGGSKAATEGQQLSLLALLADTSESGCATAALESWRREALSPAVRAAALRTAASCSYREAEPAVARALASPSLAERAAGVAALGWAPKDERTAALLSAALEAPEAALRVAACEAVGVQRASRLTPALARLAKATEPSVRRAALEALATAGAAGAEGLLCGALENDPDATVRQAAARRLAGYAGPRVLSVLNAAAQRDRDDAVKLVAAESLRKLGAWSSTP